jgi:type II secretory pathway pseudopilin PulG
MNAMRSREGITLIETLIVILVMAIAISIISLAVFGQIDRARGSALMGEARVVFSAGELIMLEERYRPADSSVIIYDEDYEAGLSGTVDNASRPEQTRISRKIAERVAPGIVLSAALTEDTSCAAFDIENGEIITLAYDTVDKGRHYRITVYPDGEATVERIN